MNEHLELTGRVTLVLTGPNGEVKERIDKDNLVVQVGKNFVANALVASSTSPFGYIAIGTSGTAPANGDTTLGAEIARVACSSATASTNVATFIATFGAGVGTGSLQEAGILNAASLGTLFSHLTYTTIAKAAGDTLTITWAITCG